MPPPRSRSSLSLRIFLLFILCSVHHSLGMRYTYLTYSQIHYRLTELATAYPNLIRLYSAQDRFSLPHVGNCTEQISQSAQPQSAPCTIWIVELTNFDTVRMDPSRPEVLVSGELHGNEVIGPQVALAYIEFMAQNYHTNSFVKRLVDSRLVTLVPMTNAIGFQRNEREERQGEATKYDPNRDFGFDQKPTKCMQTVAARALNELFRVHIYRLLITFHGGTNVIGYEWGDTSHCNGNVCNPAPDLNLMRALAKRMADNAGPAGPYEATYRVGDMGSTVYSVNGGLEDWAYGASWAKEGTSCQPSTLGGYAVERTRIDRTTKRCVTYLVETARDKKPTEDSLGTDDAILERGGIGDGHVPRNVRLLLSAVDAAEPYVIVDDKVETSQAGRPVFSWAVSGAFIVDGTVVQWSTMNGTHTGWSNVLNGTAGVTAVGGKNMQFKQELPMDLPYEAIPVYIRVAAVVDRPFIASPNGSDPNVTPQSHLMGSRGSPEWVFSVGEKQLKGQQVFFSPTLKVVAGSGGFIKQHTETKWGVQQNSGMLVTVPEKDLLHAILFNSGRPDRGPMIPAASGVPVRTTILTVVAGCVGIVAVGVAILVCVRRKPRRQQRKGVPSFTLDDEEDVEAARALTATEQDEEFEEEEVISASGIRSQEVTSAI